jgi:hypothetical protein
MRSDYFVGLAHGFPLVSADKIVHIDNSVRNGYFLRDKKGRIMN